MEHFDGARLSPNSVRNAVWRALNEPVCQCLQTRNPRCSTVYIDNSLRPLARDSPCIYFLRYLQIQLLTHQVSFWYYRMYWDPHYVSNCGTTSFCLGTSVYPCHIVPSMLHTDNHPPPTLYNFSYRSTLQNIPEQRRFYSQRFESLKSRIH